MEIEDSIDQKKLLKIENLEQLLSVGTLEVAGNNIPHIGTISDIASFRISPDDAGQLSNSFNRDPAVSMGALQISPITKVNLNFSDKAGEVESQVKIKKLNIKEEISEFRKSIDLLSPDLKKLNSNQFTPSFPVKSEDSLTWGKIKLEYIGEKGNINSNIDPKLPEAEEILSNAPNFSENKAGDSNDSFKKFESNFSSRSLIEDKKSPGIRIEENLVDDNLAQENIFSKTISSDNISFEKKTNLPEEQKFNNTIFYDSDISILQSEKIAEKNSEQQEKLYENIPNPNLKLSTVKLAEFKKENGTISKQIRLIKKKKRTIFTIDSSDQKKNIQSLKKPLPVIIPEPKKPKNFLPKIKKPQHKPRSLTKDPYTSSWSTSVLKSLYSVDVKINSQPSSVKYLVTKLTKKRRISKTNKNLIS